MFNPLTDTLKPQSNEPLYSNMVIGALAVVGWPSPLLVVPINGQCTSFIFDVAQ